MSRSKIAAAVLAASLLGSLSAQSTLTTLFADNNGGSVGGNVYFDITVTNTVRISSLETNYSVTANTACGVKVYTVPKTYVGNETNKSAWTLVGQDDGKAVSAGRGQRTKINLATPILLTPGTYGMALEAVGSGHAYTNGTATNNSYKDSNLALQLGAATNVPFTGSPFTPRIWNGSIIYTLGKGIFASFTADKTSGPGPLTVQFKDTTYSSAPPILTWAWDFDGDNKIDSKVQNPSFTYPKTTWDATYDVTLTVTDATNGQSKLTKKAFITVDPSNATAVDFGAGSTNKPLPGPIKLPNFSSLYTSTAIRGLYFQAPGPIVITGLRVPQDHSLANQTVSLYVMAARPPAYSATYTTTAADQKFFTSTAKANALIQLAPPVVVKKGEWVGVLGGGYSGSGTTVSTSYATPSGPFKSSVGGVPITVARLLMQGTPTPFITNKGLGPISTEDAGNIGRIEVFCAGNVITPLMTTVGRPALGSSATLDMQANIAGAQGGVVLLSSGRLPVPVPTMFGNLLITPAIIATIFVSNGTGQLPVSIPNNSALTGTTLDWQGLVYDLTSNTFGMTNGSEWFLGK